MNVIYACTLIRLNCALDLFGVCFFSAMILNTVMNQHATVSFRVENSPTELINSAHSLKLIGFIIHFVGDFNNYFVHTCNQSQIAPNKSFRIMKHQWKWPNLFKKFAWNHFFLMFWSIRMIHVLFWTPSSK